MAREWPIKMIRQPGGFGDSAEVWYDLGCGSGAFTQALAELLPTGSLILAVDKNPKALERLPNHFGNAKIQKIEADFTDKRFAWTAVNGMLLANSLHFVHAQRALLKKTAEMGKRILVVEYERRLPNPWQPYPVSFTKLSTLLSEAGYTRVRRLTERASRYGGTMYSALGDR